MAGFSECGSKLWVPQKRLISSLTENLLVSHEGLCSMELVKAIRIHAWTGP